MAEEPRLPRPLLRELLRKIVGEDVPVAEAARIIVDSYSVKNVDQLVANLVKPGTFNNRKKLLMEFVREWGERLRYEITLYNLHPELIAIAPNRAVVIVELLTVPGELTRKEYEEYERLYPIVEAAIKVPLLEKENKELKKGLEELNSEINKLRERLEGCERRLRHILEFAREKNIDWELTRWLVEKKRQEEIEEEIRRLYNELFGDEEDEADEE